MRAEPVLVPTAVPMSRGRVVVVAGLLAVFVTFSNLGFKPLNDWDEAWHALVALDMARGGSPVTYSEEGALTSIALRPPLHFWMMASAFRLLGPTPFAARLFSAACYVALVVVVTAFCARRLNWTVALLAAFLLCTHDLLMFHHGARSGDIEAPLMLFSTATMLGVYEWRCRGKMPWWVPAVWAAALLAKGPAALQVVPVVVVWLLWERAGRMVWRVLLTLALGSLPLVLFQAMREVQQPGALRGLVLSETAARITTDIDGGEGWTWRPLATVLAAGVPILLALAVTLSTVRFRPRLADQLADGAERSRLLRFLLLWWLIPTAFLGAMHTQKSWYFYPSLVPACLLAAWALRAGVQQLEAAGRRRSVAVAAGIVLLGMGAPALWRAVTVRQADYELNAEYAEFTRRARPAEGEEPLIAYGLWPADRFALRAARVPYQRVEGEGALREAVGSLTGGRLLAYRIEDGAEVARVLGARPSCELLRLARRGTVVAQLR